MRDWNSEARRNRDVLVRIVALLVALADLADLASGLSVLRRRRLLEILMCGEAEAFAFVTGMTPAAIPFDAPGIDALACAYELEPAWNDPPEQPCDPARLAASLRAVALALWSMLMATRRLTLAGTAGPRTGQHEHAAWAHPSHQAALPAPDTS